MNTNIHQSREIKAYSDIFKYAGKNVKEGYIEEVREKIERMRKEEIGFSSA